MIPKRKIALNFSGVRCVAENAAIGVANASPVRTAAGIAEHDQRRGDRARTASSPTVKIAAIIVSRIAIQTMLPRTMSRGDDRRRVHRVERPLPVEAAHDRERRLERRRLHRGRREQARARGTGGRSARRAPGVALPDWSTYVPSPRPIAGRNRTGLRNDVKIDARNVRRYWSARCSTTRVITAIGAYSISDRPVSRRKTSSRVDRRTRTVSGRRPRSWAATAAASPSSA